MNLIAFSLLMGSLWGGGDLLIWSFLRHLGVGMKSPYVFAYGILLLSFSRTIFNKRGSSLLVSLVAASFKFLGSPVFFCQLLALVLEGLSFEIGFSFLGRSRPFLLPALASFSSYSGFALSITYIFKVSGWVKRGVPGVLHYMFVNGSLALLFSLLTFNLGVAISLTLKKWGAGSVPRLYKKYGLVFSIILFIALWVVTNART